MSSIEKEYPQKDKETLEKELTAIQYGVTQQCATEIPFENEYWDHYDKGIYVDITSGQPLFVSSDKFDSGCGWPSFSRPISAQLVKETLDIIQDKEISSVLSDAHLGHVFDDGPEELGGLRYCINSAALKFIPLEKLEEEGYGAYKDLVQ
ncbi:MAG: peptide-methionine (R)-S-oxide reductase MsrB [Clostridiales Family XIII bacterium]|nr:peptide-methionine (R)-S-oxide reductase MsrB [Clostridiales Family XIII bacterium]